MFYDSWVNRKYGDHAMDMVMVGSVILKLIVGLCSGNII